MGKRADISVFASVVRTDNSRVPPARHSDSGLIGSRINANKICRESFDISFATSAQSEIRNFSTKPETEVNRMNKIQNSQNSNDYFFHKYHIQNFLKPD